MKKQTYNIFLRFFELIFIYAQNDETDVDYDYKSGMMVKRAPFTEEFIMINLKKLYCYFSGQVYIDPQLKRIKGKTLLHITDTPKSIFPALSRLIRELNPNYIVHTGDLVDNIKLGLLPGSIYRYTRDVAPLIDLLEASPAEKIFIAIGNHDNLKVVQDIAKRY